jgi:Tfp pilus assembly protein PilN
MIEINLIPDVKRELLKAQHLRAAVISGSIIASIIAGGLVLLLVLYVFGVQTLRSSVLDGDITKGDKQLSSVEDLSKVLTIQNQLAKISALNADKNINSRLFDLLDAVTPTGGNSVQFSQITVNDEEQKITLEGQTRGYDSMEVFKKTLAGSVIEYTIDDPTDKKTVDVASDISTTDASFGEDTAGNKVLRFTLLFTYADELFSPATKGIAFRLTQDGNVTDSYLGIPKSLFTERAKDL